MKSPPSSEHGIAHPVKTWPSSPVSRFPHFLKTRFTRFPHFSGYRAALFRPRDCIKRRFRRFYRLTVKRRAATRRLAEWRSGSFRGILAGEQVLDPFLFGESALELLKTSEHVVELFVQPFLVKICRHELEALARIRPIQWICHQFLPFDHVSRHGMLRLILS